jgi:hypothetical protein
MIRCFYHHIMINAFAIILVLFLPQLLSFTVSRTCKSPLFPWINPRGGGGAGEASPPNWWNSPPRFQRGLQFLCYPHVYNHISTTSPPRNPKSPQLPLQNKSPRLIPVYGGDIRCAWIPASVKWEDFQIWSLLAMYSTPYGSCTNLLKGSLFSCMHTPSPMQQNNNILLGGGGSFPSSQCGNQPANSLIWERN